MKKFFGMVVVPIAVVAAATTVLYIKAMVSASEILIIVSASSMAIATLNLVMMRQK